MFKEEDFKLPLEMEFKRSVVNAEIDECSNVEELRKALKDAVRLSMTYQHMLTKACEELITKDLENWLQLAGKIEKE